MNYPDDFVNKIITSNCVEVMRQMPDECVDLTVTSPPYDNLREYHGYTFNFPAIATELYRVTKDGGVVVWVVGDATINGSETGTSFRQALGFMDIGFRLHDTMIWNKGGFTAVGTLQCRYASVFEYMFILTKGKIGIFNPISDRPNIHAGAKMARMSANRQANGTLGANNAWKNDKERRAKPFGIRFNIWDIPPSSNQSDKEALEHPASFPNKLAQDHILSWSNAGDLVLDPMCGSGTACKAAVKLERSYIGIDISPEYCQIAEERIRAELAQPNLPIFN